MEPSVQLLVGRWHKLLQSPLTTGDQPRRLRQRCDLCDLNDVSLFVPRNYNYIFRTVLGISERRRVKDFKVGSVVGERIQGYGDGDGGVKQPLE